MRYLVIFIFCLGSSLLAQISSPLRSGPMLGYVDMREAVVWIQTKTSSKVYVQCDDLSTDYRKETLQSNVVLTKQESAYTAKLVCSNLKPNTEYAYHLYIDDVEVERPYPFAFTTSQATHLKKSADDLVIAVGSCVRPYDPTTDPEADSDNIDFQIFESILKQKPNAMFWLGDNVYLRASDWNTKSGYNHRYSLVREIPQLQPLLANCSHFAIWDDHDFGPNNATGSWFNKAQALESFKSFWPNPTYGYPKLPGIMSSYQIEDVSVYFTDNRYYRTNIFDSAYSQVFGKEQLDLLIDQLKGDNNKYKLILMGGQCLNSAAVYENMANYPSERSYFLKRISDENINGIIILSGDRHHSEISKVDLKPGLSVWEVTTSPLIGSVNMNVTEINHHRIEGSLIQEECYSLLKFYGKDSDRKLVVEFRNKKGKKLLKQSIVLGND